MVIADDGGRYVEANPAACELFGLPREELLGRSIADFAPEGFDFEDAWRSFSTGKNERGLFPLVRADGERRVVEYSATREILPGHHLSIMRDVTAREANEERIRRQRDELDTLNRINELVRGTIDDVVDARTRDTIERTVCETIADSALYAFALIGERDRRSGGLTVRTGFGVDRAWLDRMEGLDERRAEEGPGVRAIRTDELQLLEPADIAALPEGPRGIIRDSGASALLVAPLSFGSVGYGFLAVGANRESAFAEREVEGFSALANAIGFAINAVESKQSLSADATVVLEIEIDDPDSAIARLATPEGTTVVESMLPLDSGSALVYLRTTDEGPAPPPPGDQPGVEKARVLERSDDGARLEVVLDRQTPVHALHDAGARVREATVDRTGTWYLEVASSPDRDVRSVVDPLQAAYEAVRLQSKGVEGDPDAGGSDHRPLDRLTERQRTVLVAALRSGYYDWPRRGSSAEDLAGTLGIAPQTVLEHLRKAERTVLGDAIDRR